MHIGSALEWRFPLATSPLSNSSLPPFFAAAGPHRLTVLKALWPAITGEALANHSEVVGIQGDVMRIRADSNSWLKILRDLKGTLVVRLQHAAGPLAPRALAFVEGPVAPRSRRKRASGPLRPPDPSVVPSGILSAAAAIPTDEGREAYLRAVAAFQARFGAS